MSEENQIPADQLTVDAANLYREDVFTDLKVATIRCLTPVKVDGSVDEGRDTIYSAETQIMTPQGMVPVNAKVAADSLEQVVEKFPAAINEALERLISDAREMRRQEASRIVTPGEIGGGKIIS